MSITRKVFRLSLLQLTFVFIAETRAAVEFTCDFGMATYATIGSVYYCDAEVTIAGESKLLESVEGTHEDEMANEDVEYLRIWTQNLPFIPGDIDNFFKNIKGLDFFDSNLTTISAEDLKQFPNLLLFGAERNKLVSLDGNLFKHTPLLRWISFQSNQIQHVGQNLVEGLINLEELNFANNPCVDVNAVDRTAILSLNDELPIFCPSLASTTTESLQECPIACLERIESSEIKVSEQNSTINELTERLTDLEKKVREITSSAGSPCSFGLLVLMFFAILTL